MLTMLMYHRILPQEHPEAVSVPMFRRQLDYLQRHYQGSGRHWRCPPGISMKVPSAKRNPMKS